MWTVEILVMLAMIALNGVFAGYEIALASIGVARLRGLASDGRRGAAAALRMKENMESSLAVVQMGITLVGAIAAAVGGAGAGQNIAPALREMGLPPRPSEFLAIAIVVLPITVVTIICGELVPKIFALRNREWFCLTLSRPMEWFSRCVWPAVWGFETIVRAITGWAERRWNPDGDRSTNEATRAELREIASLARTTRMIGHRQERIITSAARLSTTPVRHVMLPAADISLLTAGDTFADALIVAHEDMHTRFPVTEQPGDPQHIVGYANFKDIVASMRLTPEERHVRAIARPLLAFDGEMTVADCLEQMIRAHNHIALVRDKAGKVLGMITIEDIVEEMLGEIYDEHDRLPSHVIPAGTAWVVGGNATCARIREASGILLPATGERPTQTLNDWVLARLGRPARGGELIEVDSVRVLVRKVRRQTIQEAQLSQAPKSEQKLLPAVSSVEGESKA